MRFTVDSNINVQFNPLPYHSRPLSKNVAANILYKSLLPEAENNDITVSLQPLVVTDEVSVMEFSFDFHVCNMMFPHTYIVGLQLSRGKCCSSPIGFDVSNSGWGWDDFICRHLHHFPHQREADQC